LYTPPPYENNLYNQYKENDLIVEIEATGGRINKRDFTKRIEDIIDQAIQIPP
jgi:hypothetical protein